jgi:hypothetical protein
MQILYYGISKLGGHSHEDDSFINESSFYESFYYWQLLFFVSSSLLFPCFGRHVKLLVPAAFAVVSSHSSFKEGWRQAGGQS